MRQYALYRIHDGEGRLLYVGISMSFLARMAKHRDTQPWWSDIARVDVERLGAITRRQAEGIELAAIHADRPLFNRVGMQAPTPERLLCAVRRAVPAGRSADAARLAGEFGRAVDALEAQEVSP